MGQKEERDREKKKGVRKGGAREKIFLSSFYPLFLVRIYSSGKKISSSFFLLRRLFFPPKPPFFFSEGGGGGG